MIEYILGILTVALFYCAIQIRNERRARHNQMKRLEDFFFSHTKAEEKRDRERGATWNQYGRDLHGRINELAMRVSRLEKKDE